MVWTTTILIELEVLHSDDRLPEGRKRSRHGVKTRSKTHACRHPYERMSDVAPSRPTEAISAGSEEATRHVAQVSVVLVVPERRFDPTAKGGEVRGCENDPSSCRSFEELDDLLDLGLRYVFDHLA